MDRGILAAAGAMFCIQLVVGQAQGTPSFEVATVKPSGPDSPPMSIQRQPGRLTTSNTPLSMLVSWAFDVDQGRVVGAPKAAESTRFDIVARTPDGGLPPGQLQLMMRNLLAERFNLLTHLETRQLAAYDLVIDPGGFKLKLSAQAEPTPANPFRMNEPGILTGTHVTADMLAKVLSNQLARPVSNSTGLIGVFDFTLQWTPDGAIAASPDTSRPALTTAVREQLGLRLNARTSPVEVVVIDRLEVTPTAN